MNVKIIGAGSIGNHLAHASRKLNWNVTLCDIDVKALDRTKNLIYPSRYGKWDNEIILKKNDELLNNDFDLLLVGTPPEYHIEIVEDEIKRYQPKAILIEKPLTSPDLKGINSLRNIIKENKIQIFIGYDHLLAVSLTNFLSYLNQNKLGTFCR